MFINASNILQYFHRNICNIILCHATKYENYASYINFIHQKPLWILLKQDNTGFPTWNIIEGSIM